MTGVSAYDVRDGALYLQSGRGFTPFGYIKPEVVAPGVELTGTYPGNRYGTMTGTSVAAAVSYTHLDVYKRQNLMRVTGFIWIMMRSGSFALKSSAWIRPAV